MVKSSLSFKIIITTLFLCHFLCFMHSPSLFLITIWCYHRLSSPPCRDLICKVSTFLCVCVVWFVVVVSLFLIRPALTKPSLYCHIWALLGSGTFSESHPDLNCFKRLADPLFSLALHSLLHPCFHSTTDSFVPHFSLRVWHKWRDIGMRGDLI